MNGLQLGCFGVFAGGGSGPEPTFITLDDRNTQQTKTLTAATGLLIKPMVWATEQYITGKEILLVLCSEPYDAEDYIEDKEEFKKYEYS